MFHFLVCMSLDCVKAQRAEVIKAYGSIWTPQIIRFFLFILSNGGTNLCSRISMEQFSQDDFSTVRLNLRIKLV